MEGLKRRYRALPLIASPLEHEEHEAHHHAPGHGVPEQNSHGSSTNSFGKEHVNSTVREQRPTLHRMPTFREREEASSIELFYDLFFVANLSSFTTNHSIDDAKTIKSYIGFFSLLWFTWLQVTLYDVRFSVDSVFERVCKALHLGIMIGFAVSGTRFDTSETAYHHVAFQQFSIIMMVSKIILFIQYGYVLLWVKQHNKIRTPLLIHMGAFAVGAAICLGLTFTFSADKQTNAYLTWYVIAVVEALVVFASSSQWRTVSFKRTNLNERVGLLTLIILGEGVIVLTKSMSYVTKGENYTAAIIGQIIASTLIIYFLYMLYFDQVDAKRFGTIRQQFWALAHFPFHVALVLLLEGMSRFVMWRNATEIITGLDSSFMDLYSSSNDTAVLADGISSAAKDLYANIEADASKYDISKYLTALKESGDPNSDKALESASDILVTLANATLKYFKIAGSKASQTAKSLADPATPKDPFKDLSSVLHVYDLVFVYFFIAAGCTLLMMAVLVFAAKKNKCAGDYAAVALRAVVGLALTLVAAVKGNYTAQEHFLYSPWMLPTVLLAIMLVVAVDAVLGYVMPAPKIGFEGAGHGHGSP